MGLVPMAHVADVQRSVDFYKLLGMEVRGNLRSPSGELQWVHLNCGNVDLMFTHASEPIVANQQAVLFYLYTDNYWLCGNISCRSRCLFLRCHIRTTCPKERFVLKTRTATYC